MTGKFASGSRERAALQGRALRRRRITVVRGLVLLMLMLMLMLLAAALDQVSH